MTDKPDSEASAANANDEGSPIQANFLQFLSGMAGQTLMHMGIMKNPLTDTQEVDLPNAKYSIDLLAVLQEKTKGNLTKEEEEYLTAALYQLRMSYVQVAETGTPPTAESEDAEGALSEAKTEEASSESKPDAT